MARIKQVKVPDDFNKRSSLSLTQLIELNITDESQLKVAVIPSFPKGIKPKKSGFLSAMSKRKLFRIRRK